MVDIQAIKQRFEIIGNNPGLNRAIDIATQVAPTDLSVLITGESGVGETNFPPNHPCIQHPQTCPVYSGKLRCDPRRDDRLRTLRS